MMSKLAALFAASNCSHLYLDVGSNLGVQIRKLYEPQKYPRAAVVQAFEQLFGEPPRCKVCAIGMEPNPRHAQRLFRLERELVRAGAPVAIVHAAAGTQNGETHFMMPSRADSHEDWKARIPLHNDESRARYQGYVPVQVQVLNLAEVIRMARRHIRGVIVMKLDVEGLEQILLPHLLKQRALCLVDAVFAEFHAWAYNHTLGGFTGGDSELREAIRKMQCTTNVLGLDDETYLHDGASWPTRSVCKGQRAVPPRGGPVPPLGSSDLDEPLRGFCGKTLSIGASVAQQCMVGSSGSWPTPQTMHECRDMCLRCQRCNYVSFSRPARDCSWYRDCHAPLQTYVGSPALEGTFWTLRVKERDRSD